MKLRRVLVLVTALAVWSGVHSEALAGDKADATAAERGRQTLITRTFTPPVWSVRAYESTWKQWGLDTKPADYERALMARYGLHEAPYDNAGLPMGLRKTLGPLGLGITNDCMLCHAGSIAGKSHIGLGNSSIDLQGLYEESFAADGLKLDLPFRLSNVRGTIEASAAVVYLMQFRDTDLNVLREPREFEYRDDLCEDIPAWWNLKKKKTMYHTGAVNARSVRSLMSFMLSPINSGDYIKKQEAAFADMQAYMLSLEPPKYPFPVDDRLAARGMAVFEKTCKRCHGTYGPDGKYPSRIVPLDVIGTDPGLAHRDTASAFGELYTHSWFARETFADGSPYFSDEVGYQAPPLDGVWATAPYLHNGSVPTVYHMLNSKARPKRFTRSFQTGVEHYDAAKLGWKFTELTEPPAPDLSPAERRKIYDTTLPGRSNGGHTFGDHLSPEDRMAVIEYLKTL